MGALNLKGEIKTLLLLVAIFGLFLIGFVLVDAIKGNPAQNIGQATTTNWSVPEAKSYSVSKAMKPIDVRIDEKENLQVLFENGRVETLSPMQRLMVQPPLVSYYMAERLGWGK